MNDTANSTIVRYKLVPSLSTFTVQAFADGLFAGFGHNPTIKIRNFFGDARFVPDSFAESSLIMKIDANSLEVIGDIKEKDKQEIERTIRDDILETTHFPEIIFQSTNVTMTRIIPGRWKAKIVGDLNFHGITGKGLWIMGQVFLNADELRAKGDFTLRQSDFGIKPISIAAGALKLKDELKFEFDIVGRKE